MRRMSTDKPGQTACVPAAKFKTMHKTGKAGKIKRRYYMGKRICKICGYVYDEEKEGLPFSQLPDSWVCPLCGTDKGSFAPEKASPEAAPSTAPIHIDGDMRQLSAGELSALCSNLGRGCEKQYKDAEAALFRQLADFFAAAVPEVPDGDMARLAELIRGDMEEGYPALRSAAEAAADRGTLRVCTWGEKVTGILGSLLRRYQKEGEALLENTQVWVCSVCGFIYIGDQAPELCPVCKVPAWKFDRIEGRS